MKKFLPALAAAGLFSSSLCLAGGAPAVVLHGAYDAQAEVVAVDYTARTATLKTEDGTLNTIKIGPEVKNFGQLKKGDTVLAKYSQTLGVTLKKKGSPSYVQQRTDGASAQPGTAPAAAALRETTFAADITKIDHKTGDLTVKGPKGRVVDLKVEDPKVLEGYGVGDQIEGAFVEVLAIGAVTPGTAPAAPAAPSTAAPGAAK
jgi:hypothetical protein